MRQEAEPQQQDFDELLNFLPIFADPHFRPVSAPAPQVGLDKVIQIGASCTYSSEVVSFFAALSKQCWTDTQYAGRRPNPDGASDEEGGRPIEKASLEELCRALTKLRRAERFSPGAWEDAFENGFLFESSNGSGHSMVSSD